MEDILDVYQRRYNPKRPQICLDEIQKVLHSTPLGELGMTKGKPRREDYEYERHGQCALFLAVEPLAGFRKVWVRSQRTKLIFADILKELVDELYPDAEKIVLVTENATHPKKRAGSHQRSSGTTHLCMPVGSTSPNVSYLF